MSKPKKSIFTPRSYYKPFDYPEAFEFYEQHEKLHWLPDEVPLHSDISDWKHKLNDTERHFLTQIFRLFTQSDIDVAQAYATNYLPMFPVPEIRMMLLSFGARECFDDQTEVLTDNGWKLFKNLDKEHDLVAQVNQNTLDISYTKPLDYIKKPYKGILHHYLGKRTDICVTPKHRLWLIHPKSKITKFNESENGIWGDNYLYPVNGNYNYEENELTTIEKLLIAIQADGTIRSLSVSYQNDQSRQNDFSIDFKLKKQRKIERIESYLKELGLNCNPRLQEDGFTKFTFSLAGLIDHKILLGIKDFSFLDPKNISSLKANQIIEELVFWDGNTNKTWTYYNTNKTAIDKIQHIATISKYSSTLGINREKMDEYQILNNIKSSSIKTCYFLTFTEQNARMYPKRVDKEYDGMVYCVTMPEGTVVVRRNGKVAFSGNCIHIQAYAHLIDTLGMPEVTYKQFHEYEAMKDKHDFIEEFIESDGSNLAEQIACFSAFTEGMQLFSSFIMLLNFTRFNKMNGMGQIISWSIRDEQCHVDGMTWLFKQYIKENRHIWTKELQDKIYRIAEKMVELEDKFIDLAFEMGAIEGLTSDEVKTYIRYITDRRLIGLSMKGLYKVKTNPLPWVEEILNAPEHASFFETRATAYAKGALTGSWDNVWA